ncbi:flavin reductase family protein [Methanomethylophilus alvi]|uniref:flavin reductase family protein n=1 Tax=Methanomethylophilus alvi TaxID=1291540 RepID=UPI0037DDB151
MRKDLGAKTILYPMPVLILAAYREDGRVDAMNAAWGGIADTNQVCICLSSDHATTKSITARKALTVSVADAAHTVEADYLGVCSGNDVPDKFEKSGLHAVRSENVDAPVIQEFPLTLECRVSSIDDISEGTVRVVADIVNVSADEGILTDGKVDISKLDPITYDTVSHGYFRIGERVGNAFSDGKRLM